MQDIEVRLILAVQIECCVKDPLRPAPVLGSGEHAGLALLSPVLGQNSFPPSVPALPCHLSFVHLLPPQLDQEHLKGVALLGPCTLAPILQQGAFPRVGPPGMQVEWT